MIFHEFSISSKNVDFEKNELPPAREHDFKGSSLQKSSKKSKKHGSKIEAKKRYRKKTENIDFLTKNPFKIEAKIQKNRSKNRFENNIEKISKKWTGSY